MLAFLDKIPFGSPLLKRVAFWLLTVFILYVIIGLFVVPPVTRSILTDQLSSELKRETTIENISFNPLTFRLQMDGFRVAKRTGEGDFISASSFAAAPSIATLWEFAPVIAYLHIRDLTVDITFYGDGKYSFTDLQGSKRQPEPEDDEETENIFPFALYGFELTNAKIIFDDQPHAKRHVITDLNLIVPFTSSIFDQRKEFTQPKFTAVVNGDPVDLKGRTLPFDDSLLTEFQLGAVAINLDQYWTYVPIPSSLELVKGQFTSNLSLFFERPDGQRIRLFVGGGGKLTDLELSHPQDGTVVSFDELEFQMERFSLGDNELVIDRVQLANPYIKAIRNQDGSINWTDYFELERQETPKSTEEPEPEDSPAAPFRIDAKDIRLDQGTLEWVDNAVSGGFSRTLAPLTVKANGFTTAPDRSMTYEISAGETESVTVRGEASVNPVYVKGEVEASGIDIPRYTPYLQALPMTVGSGTVAATGGFEVRVSDEGTNVMANNATATVRDLALFKPKAEQPSIGFTELAVSGASFDLASRTVTVDEVALNQPLVRIVRGRNGTIDLAETFAAEAKQETPPADDTAEEEETADAPWTATVNRVRLTDGSARYRDYGFRQMAEFNLSKIRVDLDDFSTRDGAVAKYDLSTNWGGGGSVSAAGDLTLDTLTSNGRLALRKVGLKPIDPLMLEFSELLLGNGAVSSDLAYDFSGDGKTEYSVKGDITLNDLQLMDNKGEGEFAGIDELKLTALSFANEPFRLAVDRIDLEGPRAAIAIDETGQLNVKRLFRIADEPSEATEGETTAAANQPEQEQDTFFKAIDIGTVTMNNGRVTFNDDSLTPHFRTTMTDMTLKLTDIAQTPEARPKLEFSANQGPAPMTVSGVLNPVVKPLYSDLTIATQGVELVPLSSYTIEHLGYPMEKGRLHADVDLKIEEGLLTANNTFFIEQLVLGPKDTSPDAPNVPIKFGLALLQDGNGDMRLNLPVRGRLDDPDFHIGGIIFQAIANLFIKALASPFTLIGSMFGSGEELDFVAFRPGRHELDGVGTKKLETLVDAMLKRPKLTLEVDGVVAPEEDANGLVERRFDDMLKQAKYDSLSRKEQADTTVAEMRIAPDEYEDLLFEVYKSVPDPEDARPTTLFVTDRQPVDVMERFVKERIAVTSEDLNELARLRAASVKEYIISQDLTLAGRVYLLDRRADATDKETAPKPRADLTIK